MQLTKAIMRKLQAIVVVWAVSGNISQGEHFNYPTVTEMHFLHDSWPKGVNTLITFHCNII